MPHWTDDFTFLFSAPRDRTVAAVGLISDRAIDAQNDMCVPAVWDSVQWIGSPVETLDFSLCGLAAVEHPMRQAAYLGLSGHVYFWGAGDSHEEYIDTPTASPADIGMMRSLRAIAGKAYAVGMQRQAYRRDGVGQWVDLTQGIRPAQGSGEICSFEGIDGFGEDELYACGRDGELWWYDGAGWQAIASPTNVNLTNVCCGHDGAVYVCGRSGLLMKGRHDKWQVIEAGVVQQDFWGIAWFADRLFLASMNLLFALTDKGLVPVEFDDDFPSSCFHLAVALDGSVMWSTGAKDVFSYDGTSWTRID